MDNEHAAEHHESHGGSVRTYLIVAAVLAVITAAEVAMSYQTDTFGKTFLPILLVLMAAKFVIVVSFFMHLRYDHKMFSALFYSGLGLAVFVYLAALLTFKFFAGP